YLRRSMPSLMAALTSFSTFWSNWSKLIEPLSAASSCLKYELLNVLRATFSDTLMYGLNRTATSDILSSFCRTFWTCFWNGVSVGMSFHCDLSAGTPQPLLARSTDGSPAENHSKTFQVSSAALVLSWM